MRGAVQRGRDHRRGGLDDLSLGGLGLGSLDDLGLDLDGLDGLGGLVLRGGHRNFLGVLVAHWAIFLISKACGCCAACGWFGPL